MSFYEIRENKTLAKISELAVLSHSRNYHNNVVLTMQMRIVVCVCVVCAQHDQVSQRKTTRIHHECEDEIEKSIPRIIDWHHEACRSAALRFYLSHGLVRGYEMGKNNGNPDLVCENDRYHKSRDMRYPTKVVYATSKASDQPAHTHSLIRAFACRSNIL